MPNVEPDEQEDKPLDPVMENVRRKMVRLQLVSAVIMFVSLMAVLTAVVYKVKQSDGKPAAPSASLTVPSEQPVTATAALPAGFEVRTVSLSGNQILFYGKATDGQSHAIVFDLGVRRIVADVVVWAR